MLAQGIRSLIDLLYQIVTVACGAIGIMASAVVVEELLCGTRPDVREALAEAFEEWRPALLVLAAYGGLFAAFRLIGIAGGAFLFAHSPWATALSVALFAISLLATLVILPTMYVAWVHLALRASPDDDRFFLTARYLLKPGLTTVLALLVFLALDNAPDAMWLGAVHIHVDGALALARIAYYPVLFLKTLLSNVFIVLFYLDLCARHGGTDLSQEIETLRERAAISPS